MNNAEQIWENFSCCIRAYISRKISNYSNVDDILQDVFLKIHSKIDTVKDETRIRSWIFQVTQNTVIDYYRKRKNNFVDIDSIAVSDDKDGDYIYNGGSYDAAALTEDTEEETAARDIASGLRKMVESLPEIYAQALLLVEFQGLSQTDLAKKLGISVSGAKSRVQRGRQLLKDTLMRCCHFEFDMYGTVIDSHPVACCCCN